MKLWKQVPTKTFEATVEDFLEVFGEILESM